MRKWRIFGTTVTIEANTDGGAWFIECNASPAGRIMSLLQDNQPVLNARPEQTVAGAAQDMYIINNLIAKHSHNDAC